MPVAYDTFSADQVEHRPAARYLTLATRVNPDIWGNDFKIGKGR